VRAKYPQPDGRGIIPRKWSVDKVHGPLVLLCERILKKLIQHGWPASYRCVATNRLHPTVAIWSNELGDTPDFLAALDRAVFIVCRSFGVTFDLVASRFELLGDWVVKVRLGPEGRIASASIVPAPDCPF